jgi:diaminopimelate epimerase
MVDVTMTEISELQIERTLGKIKYTFVNSGVPHAVIECGFSLNPKKLNAKALKALANIDAKFKNHKRFGRDSTNVTFFKVRKTGHIESLTFERGVQGYTQACGTGAVAAALAYRLTHAAKTHKIKLSLPGGTVWVDLSSNHPHLIGPAKEIARISLWRSR